MKACLKCGSKEYSAEGSENGDILTCMNCGNNDFIEMPIKTIYKQFEIKASYKGTKKAINTDNFNNHMVKVTNTETQQSITFEFWATKVEVELKTEYSILTAFSFFVADAALGSHNIDEFCNKYGYVNNPQANKIYRKYKKAYEKLKKIYDGDLYELYNELQEIAG